MADNAGLVGLLLEQHQLRPPPPAAAASASRAPAQITSKATRPLLLATAKNDVVDVQKGASSAAASFSRFSSSSSRAPAPTVSLTTACPFLQRCFFCHGELSDGRDIYMYRGERAFCSEECRCRHILAEEDDDDTTTSVGVVAAAADCSTQLRHQALAASFTF
uniref:FLZ-type domain-containing protein n=1 Tax=Zea mays TaxID=4577 RepID=B6SQ10_MAIZE|nr:hypothetical protein [Zea mays]|eukprot:NP_001142823.1 uncharacterized protein LOC100275205 [Zea mays]